MHIYTTSYSMKRRHLSRGVHYSHAHSSRRTSPKVRLLRPSKDNNQNDERGRVRNRPSSPTTVDADIQHVSIKALASDISGRSDSSNPREGECFNNASPIQTSQREPCKVCHANDVVLATQSQPPLSTPSTEDTASAPRPRSSFLRSLSAFFGSLQSACPKRSRLGLDKLISEKREDKSLPERMVRVEVLGKPIEQVYDGARDGPVLGSGTLSVVRLASHRATGIKYAVKCLDLDLLRTKRDLEQMYQEICIMSQLDHPSIARLEEVYESESEIFLVQELCSGGELFDRLDVQPGYRYSEVQCARLVKQMLGSVRYIHSKGIIHRDLKLENFVFSDRDEGSEMLKLIDFGLSKRTKIGEIHRDGAGTLYTSAPEVFRDSYDEKCDVWSIGVIAYLLLSGEAPFGGCAGESPIDVRDAILGGKFTFEPEEIWGTVSSEAKRFVERLLVTDPSSRPAAREARNDPWLMEMDNRSGGRDEGSLCPSVIKSLLSFKECSELQKLLREVLGFTMLPDQIQGLRKEFDKIDTEGSGEISLPALKAALLGNAVRDSLGVLAEDAVEDAFNAMRVGDTESVIHWREFVAAGLDQCKVEGKNLRLAFDRLDADHKGYITFENFIDLIGNGSVHSKATLQQRWDAISMKSAGGRITYEVFLQMMEGQANPPVVTRQLEVPPPRT